jgi:hypothetical protein
MKRLFRIKSTLTLNVLPATQRRLGLEELAASLRLGLVPQIREAEGLISQ